MGKLFLYGRTESKSRIDPYAKLTVNCPPNIVVRAESINSLARLDVNSGDAGKAVFEKLEQGNWNITFADVIYSPSQVVAISGLDYEITLEPTARMMYAMRRTIEPEVEYNTAGIEESFSAIIRATYPEGSICTCSSANTIMEASDTSGYYEFVVPCFGDWTVSCSDGRHAQRTVVSIVDDGQTEDVSIDYTTYLYNAGIEHVSWNTRNSDGTVSKEYDGVAFNAATSSSIQFGPSFITATKQDLTNIDTIFVDCVYTGTSKYNFTVCIRDNNDIVDNLEEDCLAYAQLNNTIGVLELDVSNFSGKYFIEIFYSSDEHSTGVIDSVYCL